MNFDAFKNKNHQAMRCEDAAEFVSALCDGEMIPPFAAKHIGSCEACAARLKAYAEVGAELRRIASLQALETEKVPLWGKARRITPNWWQKGWETMRIPRFAFALLLAAVVVLGSSLTIVKVRAHTDGPVLMLTAKTARGQTVHCALSLLDTKSDPCDSVQGRNGSADYLGFRVISEQGDRIELGVRARFVVTSQTNFSSDEMPNIPETQYWFHVGDKLQVKEDGSEPITVTGELMDHIPTSLAVGGTEQLDPNLNEIRFVSPVLVRGKAVLFDFEDMTIISDHKDSGLELTVPHDGRYLVSLSPLEGAAEGRVHDSRVTFQLNGQPYQFITGAPVARGEQIWILHLPSEKTSGQENEHGLGVAGADMTPYLAKTSTKN
jgi:hypothetical protein